MKYVITLLLILSLVSCTTGIAETKNEARVDIQAELAKIEQMRMEFQQTVREKRYSDLGKFTTEDMISIGPGSEDWIAYRKLREENGDKKTKMVNGSFTGSLPHPWLNRPLIYLPVQDVIYSPSTLIFTPPLITNPSTGA